MITTRRAGRWIAAISFAAAGALGARSVAAQEMHGPVLSGQAPHELKLVPQPRDADLGDGVFRLPPETRIIVDAAHAKEDRVAAETLSDEIEATTGRKALIGAASALPDGSGIIYLGRTGDDRALRSALAAAKLSIPANFDAEGYVISATPRRVIIAATTGAGLFYGVQTLRQMLYPAPPAAVAAPARAAGGRGTAAPARPRVALLCPAVRIRDWPAMRWRGIHVDLSRGPVSTMDEMKREIRTAAEFKLNLYALYLEHIFDYQSEPLIAPKEGAITADQLKELVAYGERYHVTILAEQQAFGHLHHVLEYELYSDMGETPHGHVLSPANEKSYDFIRTIYSELVPLVPGPLFHIGADETFELGQGQTKALADSEGLGRVYLDHIRRVAEILKPYHKRLLFWGDIAVKYPELLNTLPKDQMIAVPWAYDPRDSFDAMLKPFRDAGIDIIVSPGANNWNRIFPDLSSAYINIRNLVRDGQRLGALGMLNTTWNDDGETLFRVNWPAVVFGAACAWQPGESSIDEFLDRYDWAFYRNDDHAFRDALAQLGSAHVLLRDAKLGGAMDEQFWIDPFSDAGAKYRAAALPVAHDLRMAAEQALVALYSSRAKAHAHADTLDDLIFAGERLDALGMSTQFNEESAQIYADAFGNQSDRARVGRDLNELTSMNGRFEDLRDTTERLRGGLAALWLEEDRPYWLGNVTVRYDVLAEEYQKKIEQLRSVQGVYHAQGTLPTPDSLGLFTVPKPQP